MLDGGVSPVLDRRIYSYDRGGVSSHVKEKDDLLY